MGQHCQELIRVTVLGGQLFNDLLLIMDVRAGANPHQRGPGSIPHGHRAGQVPAVRSVRAAEPVLHQKRLPR